MTFSKMTLKTVGDTECCLFYCYFAKFYIVMLFHLIIMLGALMISVIMSFIIETKNWNLDQVNFRKAQWHSAKRQAA
jgi:hypothetical protein